MKYLRYFFVSISLSMLLCTPSCSPINPIRYFTILHTTDGNPPDIIVPQGANMPFPTQIQVFNPDDKIYIVLELNDKFKGDAIVCKYTFFNMDTSLETELTFHAEQLFKPSGFPNFCYAPDNPGSYKLKVYFKDKLVAAALFKVILS